MDNFQKNWEVSQSTMPSGEIPFLKPEYITWACEAVYLPKEMSQAVVLASKRIIGNKSLCALAW